MQLIQPPGMKIDKIIRFVDLQPPLRKKFYSKIKHLLWWKVFIIEYSDITIFSDNPNRYHPDNLKTRADLLPEQMRSTKLQSLFPDISKLNKNIFHPSTNRVPYTTKEVTTKKNVNCFFLTTPYRAKLRTRRHHATTI